MMSNHVVSRRGLLTSLAGGVGLAVFGAKRSWAGAEKAARARAPLSPAELKRRIRGPIMAIPTPFTFDDEVDYEGVRNLARLGLENGIKAFELTAGDSQYHALAYDEIKELTRVLVEAVAGRGVVLAATGSWWTARAVDYARFAESVGADGVQVLAPRGNDDSYVEHYRAIAESTKFGIVLHGKFSTAALEGLTEIPSIVAMKEDSTEKYLFDLQRQFGERLAIFGGGQKWRFLVGHRYGTVGYLSTYATFAPQIAVRFWEAIENNDMPAARDIVLGYDQPLFDLCLSGKRPFHAYWRGILEHFGIAKRYLRKPEPICRDSEMLEIKRVFDGLGLTP